MEEKEDIRYLLDASALYPLLRRLGRVLYRHLKALAVLDLTKYEVGNALWVEVKRGLIVDWLPVAKAWIEVFRGLRELKVEDLVDVEELATRLDVTFYDAAYIFTANRMGLVLVSEDEEMRDKASTADVDVASVDELVERLQGEHPLSGRAV